MTMTKDKIVEKGWYRLSLTNRQRFTGRCIGIKRRSHTWVQYTFDVGEKENDKFSQRNILILHQDDIASAIRLSPRYIEHVHSREEGWDVTRYKGLFRYGEE